MADLIEQIRDQLYVANLLAYAQLYPFSQPKVRPEIEERLGVKE